MTLLLHTSGSTCASAGIGSSSTSGGGSMQPAVPLLLLAALQKLSLRRGAQSEMIRLGAVKWAVDFLQVALGGGGGCSTAAQRGACVGAPWAWPGRGDDVVRVGVLHVRSGLIAVDVVCAGAAWQQGW